MRRAPIAAFAVSALLAVAWTVYWHALAARSEDRIASWAAPSPGKAWRASYGETEVSGFPFSLELSIADPSVTWRSGADEVAWRGPWLVARVAPWTLSSFSIDLPGEQTVTVGDGAAPRRIALRMAAGRVAVDTLDGKARSLSGAFEQVAATYAPDLPPVTADRLDVGVASVDGDAAYEVRLAVRGLGLADRAAAPFDTVASGVETTLLWTGRLPEGGSASRRLDAWRAAGGTVEVVALSVDWPPLEVEATGALALDGRLRPIGAFRVDVVGYRDLLAALADAGGLERGHARLAGAALDLMATRQADGRMRLAVDVSIQDGMLRVGPIPVLPVGPVLPPDGGS